MLQGVSKQPFCNFDMARPKFQMCVVSLASSLGVAWAREERVVPSEAQIDVAIDVTRL